MARSIKLTIDSDLCQSCSPCTASKACRIKAIIQIDPGEPPYLDVNRCRDCQVCIAACPYGAVRDNRVIGSAANG